MSTSSPFNQSQARRILACARHADELISKIEEVLRASQSETPFPKVRPDLAPHQERMISSHCARFRRNLSRSLKALGITPDGARFGSLHAIRVSLTFLRIAIQEMAPEYLRGYGELSEQSAEQIRGLGVELEGLLDSLESELIMGRQADLQERLASLQGDEEDIGRVRLLGRVVEENGLVEFRMPLLNIVEKLESRRFEIAFFGRVSSGKSSLINHLLRTEILPVGVNPVTAVPTRLMFGREPSLSVTLNDRESRQCPVEDLVRYTSEELNPDNSLGVSQLLLRLPNPRLKEGFMLVDTPGLGSLARQGAAHAWAYLPRCDLGIVLISSVGPINDEDLVTIQALLQTGIRVMVLISKADLLVPEDREEVLAYTRREIDKRVGPELSVHPVSCARGCGELFENWFRDQLSPYYDQHLELIRESARRKAESLSRSVSAALSARMGSGAAAPAVDDPNLEELERRLRQAAGLLEEARRTCRGETDAVRSSAEISLEKAADAVLNGSLHKDFSEERLPGVVLSEIEAVATEGAGKLSTYLCELAQELDRVLKQATGIVAPESPNSPLQDCLRELPRFEFSMKGLKTQPPRFPSIRSVSRRRLLKWMRAGLGDELDAAFSAYGRLLESWWESSLGRMKRQFQEHSDRVRAQLQRLMDSPDPSADEVVRMKQDLARLEALQAGGSAARKTKEGST